MLFSLPEGFYKTYHTYIYMCNALSKLDIKFELCRTFDTMTTLNVLEKLMCYSHTVGIASSVPQLTLSKKVSVKPVKWKCHITVQPGFRGHKGNHAQYICIWCLYELLQLTCSWDTCVFNMELIHGPQIWTLMWISWLVCQLSARYHWKLMTASLYLCLLGANIKQMDGLEMPLQTADGIPVFDRMLICVILGHCHSMACIMSVLMMS